MLENLSQAFHGVWSHKMRSFLTMLGIIIGIASIITIVSTIRGTNEQIKENLIGAGNNAVVVKFYQDEWEYDFSYNPVPDNVVPVSEETRAKLLEIDHVVNVSLCHQRSYMNNVYHGNTAFSGSLIGIDENYLSTMGYVLSRGRLFTEDDSRECRKVCLPDSTTASSLFNGENPVGKTIEIQGEPFIVVGVVNLAASFEPEIKTMSDYYSYAGSGGGTLFIPDRTWPVLFPFDEPQTVVLRADSTDAMTRIGQQASDILTKDQILSTSGNYSYKSEDLMEQAQKLQQLSNSSNKQLLWIAGISLLVGGIGVMNIMLVTVTERTQEIGLKKAIGARKRRILQQFLTEATVLTGCGGLLGIIAGIIMARLISSVMGTPTAISAGAMLIAVAFSMVIGILFGLLPAVKAANLNPIQALRRD